MISEVGGPTVGKAYSAAEVAVLLGISVRTLRDQLRRGRVGHVRIGRRVLITEEQLLAYLARGTKDIFDAEAEALAMLNRPQKSLRKK